MTYQIRRTINGFALETDDQRMAGSVARPMSTPDEIIAATWLEGVVFGRPPISWTREPVSNAVATGIEYRGIA